MSVVVVTDSTATLPADVAEKQGIVVVPLQVVIGAQVHDEGSEGATPELVAQALRDFVPVSTSRPSPAVLVEVGFITNRREAEALGREAERERLARGLGEAVASFQQRTDARNGVAELSPPEDG